jgi:hypothetical protein
MQVIIFNVNFMLLVKRSVISVCTESIVEEHVTRFKAAPTVPAFKSSGLV